MNPLDVERVLAIAAEAAAIDGVEHLDEAVRLELAHRPDAVQGVVNEHGFAIVTGGLLALVVRPSARGRERAHALISRARAFAPTAAWSHGDHPAAAALADGSGWIRSRELLRMLRPATPVAGSSERSEDSFIRRTFGRSDEAELLRVNAAAFAHHPEQGSLTIAGLRERMAEPWFDPEDLIELWDGERLAAFHWLKRHLDGTGEVYVLAVHPDYAGRGLGRWVLEAGLDRLAGVPVQLYVDADNAEARRLYEKAGFDTVELHAQYVRG